MKENISGIIDIIKRLPPSSIVDFLKMCAEAYNDKILDMLYMEEYINTEDYLATLVYYKEYMETALDKLSSKINKVYKINNYDNTEESTKRKEIEKFLKDTDRRRRAEVFE